MADPSDLEETARREAMQAEQQHKEAESLRTSDDDAELQRAEELEGVSGMLFMRSQRAKQIARDTKAKLDDLEARLKTSQDKAKSLEDEKNAFLARFNYKTPDSLVGVGVRADAAAEQEEKQAAHLSSYSDDPYKVSQAENFAAKAAEGREVAEQARKDADELRQKLNEIDEDLKNVLSEIESLEKERKSLLSETPRI